MSQNVWSEEQIVGLEGLYKNSFSKNVVNKASHRAHRTIYPITASSLSLPSLTHLALGL